MCTHTHTHTHTHTLALSDMQQSPALNSLTQDTSEVLPLKLGSQQVLVSSPHWPLLIHHSQNWQVGPVNKQHTSSHT